jgi:hypothetical protein
LKTCFSLYSLVFLSLLLLLTSLPSFSFPYLSMKFSTGLLLSANIASTFCFVYPQLSAECLLSPIDNTLIYVWKHFLLGFCQASFLANCYEWMK